MHTTVVIISTNQIHDWSSFHSVFKEALGFPSFYGRNMNAWIDCMTYLDDEDAGMSDIFVRPGEVVTLRIDEAGDFQSRCAEQYEALIECTAFVNHRRLEFGQEPILALMLGGSFSQTKIEAT